MELILLEKFLAMLGKPGGDAMSMNAVKAYQENAFALDGFIPEPEEYDDPRTHIPIHREFLLQIEMNKTPSAVREAIVKAIKDHIDDHERVSKALAEKLKEEA